MELDVSTARWLVSEPGLAAVAAATTARDHDEDPLRILERRRADGLTRQRAAAVLAAAEARRRARDRWPDADALLFTREALEQASDPVVSRWRARRFAATEVLDLCAGIGGDALALAAAGARVTAVDLDEARLVLLAHNAAVRGLEVRTRVADALAVRSGPDRWVHADPARRRGERRVRALRDHRPPVGELVARHGTAAGLGIVLSPAVDLADPDLPDGEVEFIQLDADLVEAVTWLGGARDGNAAASATLLPAGAHLVRTGPPTPLAPGPVGDLLVEVAPAAVRARLHDHLGARIGARRVAAGRALLTVDGDVPGSPWYRRRPVEVVLPARPKVVRRWLRTADELPVEIVLHGVAVDPGEWWRALGRPPRGPQGRRIELIRTDAGATAVITRAIAPVARADGG